LSREEEEQTGLLSVISHACKERGLCIETVSHVKAGSSLLMEVSRTPFFVLVPAWRHT